MRVIRELSTAVGCLIALGGIASSWAMDQSSSDVMDEQVADAHREAQILNRFRMDPRLHAYDFSAIVDGSSARLTGTVESESVKALAEHVALASEGILRVDNRIAVDVNALPPQSVEDRRATKTSDADAAIRASIRSRLLWNVHTEGMDIRIDSHAGQVTLAGSTISYAERDMAGLVAENTVGVSGVDNELVLTHQPRALIKVDRAGEQGGKTSDAWITSSVKSSLQFTRGISRIDFSVTTTGGVVSLTGIVHSKAERDLAMQVAQDIRGVKQVDAEGLTVG
jgi:hyperosmotically inducible protein